MTAEASVTGEIGTAWWVSQAERRVPDVDDNSPGQHEHVGWRKAMKGHVGAMIGPSGGP
jgi:hypothetical protein